MAHHKLGASGAHRWMNCPASVRIEADLPDSTSTYAQEGTNAHDEAEQVLLGKKSLSDAQYQIEEYVSYVQECASSAKELLVEQEVYYSDWVDGAFGTADAVIINDNHIEIVDLKYGKGLKVDAENNPQLRLYALGAYQKWAFDVEPDTITMTIVQPRLDHISSETLTIDELLDFGEEVKVRAEATLDPNAKAIAGTKQCQWCKAKGVCRERTIHALQTADAGETLTPEEIAQVLPHVDAVAKWAKEFKANATELAENGTMIPNYKLVEGRSSRKWKTNAETELADHEKSDKLFKHKLVGITEAQKIIGKEMVDSLTTKPKGNPTLVTSDSKGKEITPQSINFPIGE